MSRQFLNMEERLNFIEFRQELLFNNTDIDRLLFECEITRNEYSMIVKLMDEYRMKISNNEEVNHSAFEETIYRIVPMHNGNRNMCEFLVRDFANCGKWEEVFTVLYGGFANYEGADLD